MTIFRDVIEALSRGKKVRQNRWDKGRYLIVNRDRVVQMFNGRVVMLNYVFDWHDINRKDWKIIA